MERYVCIHGHFYQPPRENPWLEEVELQDTAYPYHDWNERITEECYWPNAASRILGKGKKIIDVVNNYTRISFDFGPTLLTWLQRHEPRLYATLLDADKRSQELFGGHGAAMAQAYNHMIMPLANLRDKRTQILWGIEDFAQRFGRKPEGMWLPETAVDLESLGIMAEQGVRFAVLAPVQAAQAKPILARDWMNADSERIDTTIPYQCWLPSGKAISLFFYHGPTSQAVASGHLLQNGEMLADALVSILKDGPQRAGLAHIATDGETFGHHHRHADMAIAYATHLIESRNLAKITVYGQFLELFPPAWEVRIRENTSWSCSHGVERWRDNCGCASEKTAVGKQQWRKPLRQALDDLRGRLMPIYESGMAPYSQDPWAVRDAYITVVNDRSSQTMEQFLTERTGRSLAEEDKVKVLKLLEMQRNAMLMYTSCAWFFDDIAGIEAVQVLHYACRAMQLARELTGDDMEPGFEAMLEQAPAHTKGLAHGKEVYDTLVKPDRADLERIAGHLAVSSIFEQCPREIDVYCYRAQLMSCERHQTGLQTLCTGRGTITSGVALERRIVDFAAYRFSEQDIIAAVTNPLPDADFKAMQAGFHEAFDKGDTTEIIRMMNVTFGGRHYSLRHLLKDHQRRILYRLLDTTWQEIEVAYRQIYQRNFTVMHLMRGMDIPLPKALAAAAEFVINQDLLKAMLNDPADPDRLKDLVDESSRLAVLLDHETLEFEAGRRINDLLDQVEAAPDDLDVLETTETTLRILSTVVSAPNVQAGQNILSRLTQKLYQEQQTRAAEGDAQAQVWVGRFQKIAYYLGVIV
jgi:alpha-amylase/alpha-mannosidase (GH57 family)